MKSTKAGQALCLSSQKSTNSAQSEAGATRFGAQRQTEKLNAWAFFSVLGFQIEVSARSPERALCIGARRLPGAPPHSKSCTSRMADKLRPIGMNLR
jgi:hypothetical protein